MAAFSPQGALGAVVSPPRDIFENQFNASTFVDPRLLVLNNNNNISYIIGYNKIDSPTSATISVAHVRNKVPGNCSTLDVAFTRDQANYNPFTSTDIDYAINKYL